MFLEQVFNSVENQPSLSDETMKQWSENSWGKDERPIELSDDMSGRYNTQLTDDEEKQYQAWAKEQGREKDVFNYDLRGAWKELQSGTMSEDDRGHLGDKYKKPNHPTFSTESIYNGADGVKGGTWEKNGEIWNYTPGRKLTSEQANRLTRYFQENEAGNYLNLKDKVYKDFNPAGAAGSSGPGWFDGMTDVPWKAPLNALTRMASGSLMLASNAMFWVRDDFRAQMAKASEDLDAWNRANFGPDAETMGKATQIIYGLVNILPEIAMYTSGTGALARLAINGIGAGYKIRNTSLAVGSALFGTDMGIAERNRLINEGVDRDTANKAGLVSGAANALGVAIPAFLGASRTMSAIYGATSNVGLNMAELKGIQYILEKQDYSELSKQYDLNLVDSTVSLVMGAAMGAAFWRNPIDIKYERAHERLYETYKVGLEKTGVFDNETKKQEKIDAQAQLNANAVVNLARINNIAPDKIVDEFAPKLQFSEDFSTVTVPDEYAMKVVNGIQPLEGELEPIVVAKSDDGKEHRVLGINGNPNLAVLPEGIDGVKSLPVRLQEETAKGEHFRQHEGDLKKIGYQSAEHATVDIAKNYEFIYEGNNPGQIVLVRSIVVREKGLPVRGVLLTEYQEKAGIYRAGSVLATTKQRYLKGRRLLWEKSPTIRLQQDSLSRTRGLTGPKQTSFVDSIGEIVPNVKGAELKQTGWNGSPYVFDTFSLQAIGTGEGHAAHGYGLYFALGKDVSVGYRRDTSLRAVLGEVQDIFSNNDSWDDFLSALHSGKFSEQTTKLLTELEKNQWLGFDNPMEAVRVAFSDELKNYEPTRSLEEAVNGYGRLYKVDIPEDEWLLREDVPLYDQPDYVKDACYKICRDFGLEGMGFDAMTGRELYDALAMKLEGEAAIQDFGVASKKASKVFSEYGIDGLRYKGGKDGECAVIWNEDAIKILEYFQREQNGIRGSFNEGTNTIKLTPLANLSTFSHEHAHWYLSTLLRLRADDGATLAVQEQQLAILNAFGIKSVDDWNALSFKEREKFQEQFAAWTEIYLTEGKSPVKGLEGVFQKFGEWLLEMYKGLVGEGAGADAAKIETSRRYEAQFGEKLPELSPEVRKCLDAMYGSQLKRSKQVSSRAQVAAARIVQATRVNADKTAAPIENPASPVASNVGRSAQGKAASDLANGRPVSVEDELGDIRENQPVVEESSNHFARGVTVGDNGRVVVLQNRNRSTVSSVSQMNSIAADPRYPLLSTSRSSQSGAPMVSFGEKPSPSQQGKTDIVSDGDRQIPVTYYVVEADSVLRSNNFDGTPMAGYGEDTSRITVTAGNGRMAGITEAYKRGTAEKYREQLIADEKEHGVSADTIRQMRHPVLVRYMNPEDVTTGFIERSNTSDVLVRSTLETAVQDSPKIRKNIGKYEFDDDGDPTKATLAQFLTDVGEISEMGNLLDSRGNPTEKALDRVRAALFYEAYRDKTLTELVADSNDKQGIKKILNAMAAFAPRLIEIREASGGAIDLAPVITDAVHRILQARINGEGVDFLAQTDMFNNNPASDIMANFLYTNRNSAKAMHSILQPFAEQVQHALEAADSPLFGDSLAVKTDLADAMGMFRDIENEAIRAKAGDLLGDANEKLLPKADVEAIRNSITKTVEPVANLVNSIAEGAAEANVAAMPEIKTARAEEHQALQERTHSFLSDNVAQSEAARAQEFVLQTPDMTVTMLDENGNTVVVNAAQKLAEVQAVDKDLFDDTAGLAQGAACVIRNMGIRE